jgi:hypothetical protein
MRVPAPRQRTRWLGAQTKGFGAAAAVAVGTVGAAVVVGAVGAAEAVHRDEPQRRREKALSTRPQAELRTHCHRCRCERRRCADAVVAVVVAAAVAGMLAAAAGAAANVSPTRGDAAGECAIVAPIAAAIVAVTASRPRHLDLRPYLLRRCHRRRRRCSCYCGGRPSTPRAVHARANCQAWRFPAGRAGAAASAVGAAAAARAAGRC